MGVQQQCGFGGCDVSKAVVFGGEHLCCEHFIVRCYELLESADLNRRRNGSRSFDAAPVRESVDECLQKALEISMSIENLNNLQKSRLLDILLWAGELGSSAGRGKTICAGVISGTGTDASPVEKLRYVKPEIRSRTIISAK